MRERPIVGMKGGDSKAAELASAVVASCGTESRKDSSETVVAAFIFGNPI